MSANLDLGDEIECPACGKNINTQAKQCPYCREYSKPLTRKSDEELDSLKNLAKSGCAEAQFKLGLFYYFGGQIAKDVTKALDLWKQAAIQGYVNAQIRMGQAYYKGHGVTKNEKEAIAWWLKAAEQGSVEAMELVASCEGRGLLSLVLKKGRDKKEKVVTNDFRLDEEKLSRSKEAEEAIKWWRKAAEHGSLSAQMRMAEAYYVGFGVQENIDEAKKWWALAAEQGNVIAKKYLLEE